MAGSAGSTNGRPLICRLPPPPGPSGTRRLAEPHTRPSGRSVAAQGSLWARGDGGSRAGRKQVTDPVSRRMSVGPDPATLDDGTPYALTSRRAGSPPPPRRGQRRNHRRTKMRKTILGLLAAVPITAPIAVAGSANADGPSTERYIVVTDGSSVNRSSLPATAAVQAERFPGVGAMVADLTPTQAAD